MSNDVKLQNIRGFTVQIRRDDDAIAGTGFTVDSKGRIVTCAHVIKAALGSQFDECLLQQLVRAPDTWIGLSMSHFALFVAYATFKRDCILITRRVAITLNVTLRHIYNEMLYSASTEFSGYAL